MRCRRSDLCSSAATQTIANLVIAVPGGADTRGRVNADVIRAVDGPLVSVYGLRPEAVSYNASAEVLQHVWIAARRSLRLGEDVVVPRISDLDAPYVDNWGDPELRSPRFWSVDRLHLNAAGHAHVARNVLRDAGRPFFRYQELVISDTTAPVTQWITPATLPLRHRAAMHMSPGDTGSLAADRAQVALAAYSGGDPLQPWIEATDDELAAQLAHARLLAEWGRAWSVLAYLLPAEDVE